MKNIHILPTDKPSRLHLGNSGLVLCDLIFNPTTINAHHIYITSDEEIKEGDWVLGNFPDNPIGKVISKYGEEFTAQSLNGDKYGLAQYDSQKIILTTDQSLDGVQSIDDEFLEWFVKNPSCEEVKVDLVPVNEYGSEITVKGYGFNNFIYKIIIPKEEPKQEYKYIGECSGNNNNGCFLDSSGHDCGCFTRVLKEPKQERMYSEEDLREAFRQGMENVDPDFPENMDYSEMYGWSSKLTEQEWFTQFKKK